MGFGLSQINTWTAYDSSGAQTGNYVIRNFFTLGGSPSTIGGNSFDFTLSHSSYGEFKGRVSVATIKAFLGSWTTGNWNWDFPATITQNGAEFAFLAFVVHTPSNIPALTNSHNQGTLYLLAGSGIPDTSGSRIVIYDNGNNYYMFAYALYARVSATVTFDPNGGFLVDPSQATRTVYLNQPYGTLPEAIRNGGYTNLGWFTEASGGTEVLATTVVSKAEDHTVYSHWRTAGGIVMLSAEGGTCTPAAIEVSVGEPYAILPVPTRAGYTFAGWFTSPSGGGRQITNSTIVSDPPPEVLYANWTETPTPQGDGHLLYDNSTGKLIYDDYPVEEHA